MSKHLTDKQKAEVITDFAAGKTKSDIARKFNVSPNAISKILKKCQSSKSGAKVQSESSKQNNHILAKEIIDKAMLSVVKDIEKTSPMDRIKIVERLTILYGNNENQKSALDRVIDAITGVINEE